MKQELLTLGKKYKNLVVLSAGSAGAGVCEDFERYFSDRYFSFGLAESNMVSAAAGFALMGKLPIVVGDSQLLFSEAFSQILNDVCAPNLNVKFVGIGDMSEGCEMGSFPNMKIDVESVGEVVSEYGPAFYKA